jgi:hypothetical protein
MPRWRASYASSVEMPGRDAVAHIWQLEDARGEQRRVRVHVSNSDLASAGPLPK